MIGSVLALVRTALSVRFSPDAIERSKKVVFWPPAVIPSRVGSAAAETGTVATSREMPARTTATQVRQPLATYFWHQCGGSENLERSRSPRVRNKLSKRDLGAALSPRPRSAGATSAPSP